MKHEGKTDKFKLDIDLRAEKPADFAALVLIP
jgi:hypothetical protein